MKISFMTLGCPAWDLETICARGHEYGFEGVDFRGYLDTLDITTLPEFTRGAAATRRQLEDAGLAVSGISSSITLCAPEKRAENLEEARRTIGVALSLGASNVRVFGGGDPQAHTQDELAAIGCEMMKAILELDGARRLHWLFETHDLWVRAQDCQLLLEQIPDPAFGALWDIGHTFRIGRESPVVSLAALGKRIGYAHVKDAVYDPNYPQAMADGWHYVLPGQGELPLSESLHLLKDSGYDGWLLCEHEKRWLPGLPEPEVLFPAFTRWIKKII